MLERLADQYRDFQDEPVQGEDRAAVIEDLRSDRAVRVALNIAWLPITPEKLVTDLYAKPPRLAEAAPELTARGRRLLEREPGSPGTGAHTRILDEAHEALRE